jgi:uncharacterized delta-60 repeat protein
MSAGTVDTTFNPNLGYVIKQYIPGEYTEGRSVAIDRVGRIVVTGIKIDATYKYNMFITRYNTNGTIDTTFNMTGYVIEQFPDGQSTYGNSVAIDSDDRIVVTGYTLDDTFKSSMFITRYNTDGTIDTTFNGTSGYVTKQFPDGQSTVGLSVAIDSDDRIVVTGSTIDDTNKLSMFITRYKTDGTIDTTFNATSGYIIGQFPDGQSTFGRSVAIASDDRIVVTGNTAPTYTDINNSMFITRYKTDGTIDDTFNGNSGYVIVQYVSGYTTIGISVAIASGNKIVVTGYTSDDTFKLSMFITRYNTNGTIDDTFNGTSGYVIVQYASGYNTYGNSVTIDSDDRIVVTGGTSDGTFIESMFITRYLGDNTTTTTTTTTTEPICLPAGTPIRTDQGIIAIEQIDTKVHTINNRRIIAVTKTITPEKNLVCFEANSMGINCPSKRTVMTPGHEVLYKGKLVQSKHFVGRVEGVHTIPYNGKDVLYNVLQEKHGLMRVNNMVLETLHPENKVAKEILKKRYLQ